MCSRGSSQPGSRAKCMPMVKVPLGVLRTASISASLMSNVTSGPERSGSAAGVAAPPQIMTNHSTRTARTANMPLRIVLLPRGVFTAQKQKGAPIPLPRHEEDCPNAPSAPGAMRQPVTIVPTLCSLFCASRARQSLGETQYTERHTVSRAWGSVWWCCCKNPSGLIQRACRPR